jgi:response regulator NasT
MSARTARGLRILAADEDHSALEELGALLRDLGHEVTAHAVRVSEAAEKIAAEDPDIAIVVLHEDDGHALELISQSLTYASGPVIALLEHGDADFVAQAAELGVAAVAYPVGPEQVQGAIEVAVRRHAESERLSEKVDQLETALERRTLIERAKGILMERHGVDDREAFEMLRTHARSQSRQVVEVARAVSDGQALLPRT